MVEYLNMHFMRKENLLALSWVMLTLSAQAEALRDPTMPPAQLLQTTGASTEIYSGPVLQSTKLGEQNKAVMISGEMVALGQQYHGAKLVKITENTATLRSADGKQQVLSMNYPIERKWLLSESAPVMNTSKSGKQKLSNPKSSNQAVSEKNDE
jgi:hypothetical protein